MKFLHKQAQIETIYEELEGLGWMETCTCPACETRITGRWDKVGDIEFLRPVSTCYHFSDFTAGANGKPTAFFII